MKANSRALIFLLSGIMAGSGALTSHWDVAVDDDLVGSSANGTVRRAIGSSGAGTVPPGAKIVDIASAGTHTFKPVFRTSAGTLTLRAINTTDVGSTWALVVVELD